MLQQVVIVGAGFAGLLAARVMAAHAEKVVLVDRDAMPAGPEVRAAVPQGNHLHTLLPGGLEVLDALFPQLGSQLDSLGGHRAGPGQWYALTPQGKTYRVSRFQPTPMVDAKPMRVQTRALLEHCMRTEVEQLPQVSPRYGERVKDIILSRSRSRVTGVTLDSGLRLAADMVVDTSGQVSRTLRWLQEAGFATPAESVVNCDFAYTSAFFAARPDANFADVGFLISSARQGEYTKRGGSMAKVEGERWLVTLAGRLGDHPPTDLQGFHNYINSLHNPKLSNLLQQAEPLASPHRYKFPRSVWRHYENLEDFPSGLLVMGDAYMHVNPGYAQGMTSACRQAWVLHELLAAQPDVQSLWRSYFRQAAEQARAPWLFAALIDFSKKGTTGDFPDEQPAIKRLQALNKKADAGDADAAALVDAVFDMRQPLSALV